LRLFNPLLIIPNLHIGNKEKRNRDLIIDGKYAIRNIEFSDVLRGYFENEDIKFRWIRFQIHENRLLNMTQQDLPPYRDLVQLSFFMR